MQLELPTTDAPTSLLNMHMTSIFRDRAPQRLVNAARVLLDLGV